MGLPLARPQFFSNNPWSSSLLPMLFILLSLPQVDGHDVLPEWVTSVRGPCTHPCCMLYIALSAAVAHSDLLEVFPQLSFSYQVHSVLNYKKKNLLTLSLFPKHLLTFCTYAYFIDIVVSLCIFSFICQHTHTEESSMGTNIPPI